MLKYKIPQIVTLIPTNSVTCYQLRQKTKKDRQEWKPPNSLNLNLVAGPGIEPGTS